jgi:endonuclease/exonuclease/phosphatase family metal-dependent hydrolase
MTPTGAGNVSRERSARLLTYNVHGFVGQDRQFEPERIARVIADVNADIMALQEVGTRGGRAFDGYQFLVDSMECHAVAGPTRITSGGPFGNLLLSRWPIRRRHIVDLTVIPPFTRTAIIADIETPLGKRIRVIAAHLGLQRWERQRQLMTVNHIIRSAGAVPIIFMGDFNFWRGAHRLSMLDQLDVRALSHPKTFPSQMPVWPLDQIRARPLAMLETLRVVKTKEARIASDHLPLLAELNLRKLDVF